MPVKFFPKNFLWGVAYSSHQVEGGNRNNDWWDWEQRGKTVEKSRQACDSWNKYSVDHKLAQDLGCKAFRLSLEWSRIEPKEGEFSLEVLRHYKNVLQDIKGRGMKRVVTLWHWTSPLWFAKKYGWHKKDSVDLFSRYCGKVIKELGGEIDIVITINEPTMPLTFGYLSGKFPPGKCNYLFFKKARANMIKAHRECYKIIKVSNKNLPIGVSQLYNFIEPFNKNSFWQKYFSKKINLFHNYYFLDKINDCQDFIGIDYYFHDKIKPSLSFPFYKTRNKNKKINDLGWEIYPKGIYEVISDAWNRYKKPIYIFENGLADKNDKLRKEFIYNHLSWLHKAIEEGADVRGYFHWSLIDNFEWLHGFNPRFGLCQMDYETMKRQPRSSYYYYQKVIKQNGI